MLPGVGVGEKGDRLCLDESILEGHEISEFIEHLYVSILVKSV